MAHMSRTAALKARSPTLLLSGLLLSTFVLISDGRVQPAGLGSLGPRGPKLRV